MPDFIHSKVITWDQFIDDVNNENIFIDFDVFKPYLLLIYNYINTWRIIRSVNSRDNVWLEYIPGIVYFHRLHFRLANHNFLQKGANVKWKKKCTNCKS